MTNNSKGGKSPSSRATNYEVGFGKPPRATQYQRGQSGNPGGRPLGARNKPKTVSEGSLAEIVRIESERAVPIRDGDDVVNVKMAVAVVRSINIAAVKGNVPAQRLSTELIEKTQAAEQFERERELEAAIRYKQSWSAEFERCAKHGLPLPDQLPHPNDIEIDLKTGRAYVTGPSTSEEKIWFERWREIRPALAAGVAALKRDLPGLGDSERSVRKSCIGMSELLLFLTDRALGGATLCMELLETMHRYASNEYIALTASFSGDDELLLCENLVRVVVLAKRFMHKLQQGRITLSQSLRLDYENFMRQENSSVS